MLDNCTFNTMLLDEIKTLCMFSYIIWSLPKYEFYSKKILYVIYTSCCEFENQINLKRIYYRENSTVFKLKKYNKCLQRELFKWKLN